MSTATSTPEQALTVRQAASVLNVHEDFVYSLLSKGLMQGAYRLMGTKRGRWRIPRAALDQFQSRQVAAAAPAPASAKPRRRRSA